MKRTRYHGMLVEIRKALELGKALDHIIDKPTRGCTGGSTLREKIYQCVEELQAIEEAGNGASVSVVRRNMVLQHCASTLQLIDEETCRWAEVPRAISYCHALKCSTAAKAAEMLNQYLEGLAMDDSTTGEHRSNVMQVVDDLVNTRVTDCPDWDHVDTTVGTDCPHGFVQAIRAHYAGDNDMGDVLNGDGSEILDLPANCEVGECILELIQSRLIYIGRLNAAFPMTDLHDAKAWRDVAHAACVFLNG